MRPLGSFNRHVNLPEHGEDRKLVRRGPISSNPTNPSDYIFGIYGADEPMEQALPTGGEKFAAGRGRSRRANPSQRMAGQALDQDLRQGSGLQRAFAQPMMGEAELRTPTLPQ
jgi:hypothetical protein